MLFDIFLPQLQYCVDEFLTIFAKAERIKTFNENIGYNLMCKQHNYTVAT